MNELTQGYTFESPQGTYTKYQVSDSASRDLYLTGFQWDLSTSPFKVYEVI